ncbi:MAG: PIN domain-containing protein [Candidatus Thermoplasmatota archaeon]
MRLLLDSFALVEFFKGSSLGEKVKKYIEEGNEIIVSVLSIYEVGYRIEQDYSKRQAEDYLRSLKTHYQIIDVDEKTALKAVEIKKEFKLPAIDCLIYATAKINNAKVVSGCPHFKSISKQKDVIVLE